MDIKQLRYFMATAKHLNFTEAAKHLFIAQPALSRQIADLEACLNVQLFIRNKRGLQLTAAGAELLSEAHAIIAKSEEAVRKVKLVASGVKGSLKVGYLGTSERKFLPQLLRTFCKKNPHIGLSVNQSNWATLSDALDTGELDVAFTLTFGLEAIPALCCETVYTEFLSLVVSDQHPLAHESKVKLTALTKESFILIARSESPHLFDHLLRIFATEGFYPNIISQHALVETVLMLVEAGLGVTLLSRHVKNYASPSLRFVDIDHSNASVDLVMVWKATNTNPCIPLFLSELKDSLQSSNINV
ncbi:LysR family transcriptional regulator [Sporomusaceae bacterium FL31]|nr:LysR family transcriptional regulator [Sporomusaceae bacterium FL31]GCE33723.1 LysR family transcriptional regulator [Sporomusaceae bacterium]